MLHRYLVEVYHPMQTPRILARHSLCSIWQCSISQCSTYLSNSFSARVILWLMIDLVGSICVVLSQCYQTNYWFTFYLILYSSTISQLIAKTSVICSIPCIPVYSFLQYIRDDLAFLAVFVSRLEWIMVLFIFIAICLFNCIWKGC